MNNGLFILVLNSPFYTDGSQPVHLGRKVTPFLSYALMQTLGRCLLGTIAPLVSRVCLPLRPPEDRHRSGFHAGILSLLLLGECAVLPVIGQDQLEYKDWGNGGITITRYRGPGGALVIPQTIDGLKVIGIGDVAFSGCISLASIVIPNGVTEIEGEAFYGCSALTNVSLPNTVSAIGWQTFAYCPRLTNMPISKGVREIGGGTFIECLGLVDVTIPDGVKVIADKTFFGCASLTTIAIPNSVTNIGDMAFADCSGLTAIHVDVANPSYSSLDGVLFDKNRTVLIRYPAGRAGSYTIPDTVTLIQHSAFSDCGGLTQVRIPNGVTRIEHRAFFGCAALNSVTLPATVEYIGEADFLGCTKLHDLYFLGYLPYIGVPGFGGDSEIRLSGGSELVVYHLAGIAIVQGMTRLGHRPIAPWLPKMRVLETGRNGKNGPFGFDVEWAPGQSVVIEAATDLARPDWTPLHTIRLIAEPTEFTDTNSINNSRRFYRLRSR